MPNVISGAYAITGQVFRKIGKAEWFRRIAGRRENVAISGSYGKDDDSGYMWLKRSGDGRSGHNAGRGATLASRSHIYIFSYIPFLPHIHDLLSQTTSHFLQQPHLTKFLEALLSLDRLLFP